MSETVVVITGAAPLDGRDRRRPRGAVLVAADGGLDHALPPGWSRRCSSATSTRSRRAAWRGRRARRRSCATRSTRRDDTELAIAHAASLGARADPAGGRAAATGSTTPSPRSVPSAQPPSPVSTTLEAWWGDGPAPRHPRAGRSTTSTCRSARRSPCSPCTAVAGGVTVAGRALAAASTTPRAARRPRRQQRGLERPVWRCRVAPA